METVTTAAQSPVAAEVEDDLHLLTDWARLEDHSRVRKAGVLSVVAHVAAILALMLLPDRVTEPIRRAVARQITPLIAPLTELTQTAPNQGKIQKEFNVDSEAPRPRIKIPPASPPPSRTLSAPKLILPPQRKPTPAMNLPEAPRIEQAPPQTAQALPQPQIQPVEKPKLAFENVPPAGSPTGKGTGKILPPSASVEDALRSVARGGSAGGLVVGDPIEFRGGLGGGLNSPAVPGKPGANMELLSDPQGVDFRPYLIRVLAEVKANWFAVYPETAKLGRQGKVALQFIIARDGTVVKLVLATHSGTDSLDKAAVAAISASNPLPPLPTDYKGKDIRLQLNFAYNLK